MLDEIVLALNLFGTKAIIAYVIIILAVVAFGVYMRGAASRR